MILAIDVGNTQIVIALFDGDDLKNSWRISTDKNKSSDEIGMVMMQMLSLGGINCGDIEDVIISSVVPPVMHSLTNAIKRYIGCTPLVVGAGVKTGLNIRIDNPREIGADRIVNAVAAIHKYGAPVIIVDFGTANTYCAVNREGEYLGGTITAGVKISMDALFERAAKLPKVEIIKPNGVIGKNTVSAMQAGAIYGQAGQVDRIVKEMKVELDAPDAAVIATGGFASLIAAESKEINVVDKTLTLDGLNLIYKRNK